MFENQPQQFVPDYLANQKALGSLFGDRATNYLAEQEGIRKDIAGEAALPETLLKSKLGAMQTQGKIDTFGQEENIRKQDLSRTEQFNSLRAMRAMLDDPTFPDDQLVDYAVGAVKLIAKNDPNHNPDAKLADAKRSAVWSHLEEAARQNPRGIKGMLEQAMKWYAMDVPTTNKITEQDNQGYNTQVNTLLHDQSAERIAAMNAGAGAADRMYQWSSTELTNAVKDMRKELSDWALQNSIPLLMDGTVADPGEKAYSKNGKPVMIGGVHVTNGELYEAKKAEVERKHAPRIQNAEKLQAEAAGRYAPGLIQKPNATAPAAPANTNTKKPEQRKPLSSFGSSSVSTTQK